MEGEPYALAIECSWLFGVKANAALCSFARSNKGKYIYTPSCLHASVNERMYLSPASPILLGLTTIGPTRAFLIGGHDVVSGEIEPTDSCKLLFFRRGKNGENEASDHLTKGIDL